MLAAETIAAVAAAEATALFSGGLPPLMTVSRQPVAVTRDFTVAKISLNDLSSNLGSRAENFLDGSAKKLP